MSIVKKLSIPCLIIFLSACQSAPKVSVEKERPKNCKSLGVAKVGCVNKSDCGPKIKQEAAKAKANVVVCCDFASDDYIVDDQGRMGLMHILELYQCDA